MQKGQRRGAGGGREGGSNGGVAEVKEKKAARRDGVSSRTRREQRKESRRKETGAGDLGNKSGIRKRETMARVGEERGGGWRERGIKGAMRSLLVW